jgi:hypothetical protein
VGWISLIASWGATEPCGIVRTYIPDLSVEGLCHAMEYEDGRFGCGMIRHPSHYIPDLLNDWADGYLASLFAQAPGAGKECDTADA